MEHAVAKLSNNIYNTSAVPCEKSKMVSYGSSIIKNIVVPSARSRFPVKSIYCMAFVSASSACCLLKSVAIIL